MAMQLTITSDLEALVQEYVDSGAFNSAEDVVRHVFEVLMAEESWT
jgi:Arc/MetJ-type ribon-helix-helix transcriptional regulator